MQEAFKHHESGADKDREDILQQACSEFTDMSHRLKGAVEPKLLELLETLPLEKCEAAGTA
jgi:hypothetical protein